jgi:soluble lytic murein transglycosylase-like protein
MTKAFIVSMAFMATLAFAQADESISSQAFTAQPAQADDCITQGSLYHDVNPWLVRSILKVESNFNQNAINKNRNGTIDVGAAQINSMHFKELGRYGITPADLMNGCVASYVAAWHLKKQMAAHGNTWFAVGAYHSVTPCFNRRYSNLVWNVLFEWKVVSGQHADVQSIASCKAQSVRSH